MADLERRRGRIHDAEGAREAILHAAAQAFAQNGFDGARIDAIAAASGYNKSLIFHYFEDKLGLYTAIIKRIKTKMHERERDALAPFFNNENLTQDANLFREFLETAVRTSFDVMMEHPETSRMFTWEMAEGWKIYHKTMTPPDFKDFERIKEFFAKAQTSGIVRPDYDPIMGFIVMINVCRWYMCSLPLYQRMLPGENLSSPEVMARAREQIVRFVIHGVMVDPPDTKQ